MKTEILFFYIKMACPKSLDKDIAYMIKRKIRDSLTVCRFNQVCRTANLHEVRTLPNGNRHGFRKHYHPFPYNEHVSYEGTYKDDTRHGRWKWYYVNGQVYIEGTYKDDNKHGLWKEYYENGQLWCEGTYRAGAMDGLWKWYYDDGTLKCEENYEN